MNTNEKTPRIAMESYELPNLNAECALCGAPCDESGSMHLVLLNDTVADQNVCDLCGWDHVPYLMSLKHVHDGIPDRVREEIFQRRETARRKVEDEALTPEGLQQRIERALETLSLADNLSPGGAALVDQVSKLVRDDAKSGNQKKIEAAANLAEYLSSRWPMLRDDPEPF